MERESNSGGVESTTEPGTSAERELEHLHQIQERSLVAFLLDVLGSREFWELAPSKCRQAGCVTPTVRLLLVLLYCPNAVLGDTETT